MSQGNSTVKNYYPWVLSIGKCVACNGSNNVIKIAQSKQQRIWNTVRVPASLYLSEKAALNVVGSSGIGINNNSPLVNYNYVNWNQMSDRAKPSRPMPQCQNRNASSGCASTERTQTSMKPGASSVGGLGVDVKHGSYARYLLRLKGSVQSGNSVVNDAIQGNKTKNYNIINPIINCACV